ncbi:MAG: hypothetical protein BGO95_00635 [Micrococcales bacterium 73-13]|nr:MAG: hypothetical protein BGO95_00635 [Micrococcales bacterium 73-13]
MSGVGATTGDPARGTTVSDVLVDGLIRAGIDVVFGVPGLQLDPLFDAFARRRDELRVVHTRHEQAASYMADGYARASGRIGCFAVVPGPGLLNAGAGIATALATSSPVLGLVADVPSGDRGRRRGVLHELPDQWAVLSGITKAAYDLTEPTAAASVLSAAVRAISERGAGPVGLQVPADVLSARVEPHDAGIAARPAPPEAPDPAQVAEAARLLAGARAPLVLVGGGMAPEGCAALADLSRRLGAPVIMSRTGRGLLPDSDPLAFTEAALPRLLSGADTVLALGSRFLEPGMLIATYPRRSRPAVIQVDADPAMLGRGGEIAIGIAADAATTAVALSSTMAGVAPDPSWLTTAAETRKEIEALLRGFPEQHELAGAIRSALPPDGIVVSGMTQLGYWANVGYPVERPRTFLTPGYQGTLGFELATALGAKVGAPGQPVVALVGDGGVMFTIAELATAVQHEIDVIAIVFNDGAFGNVKRIQQEQYGGRVIATDLVNPDFVRLAESFGVRGRRAGDAAALRLALEESLSVGGPTLIEVPVGSMADVRTIL